MGYMSIDVKTVCLGILSLGDATGYDLKKRFESTFGHFFQAGYGSIYPALAQLADTDLVSCCEVFDEGKPAKKVYRITEAGTRELVKTLGSTTPTHKIRSEFLAVMYFAELVDPRQLERIIDHRVSEMNDVLALLDQLKHDDNADQGPGPRFVRGFGETVLRAALEYIETHRREVGNPDHHHEPAREPTRQIGAS
jgi:DNA-binding PadR family transcriptional regulator